METSDTASPPGKPRLARWRRGWWIAAALALLALVLALRQRPADVDAVQPRAQALTRTLQFSARVQTPQRVDLGATITGRVARVAVREGDGVTAGTVLLELESDEARAALAQAEASLRQADARLRSQQVVARPSADAALAQAEANLATAERELARTRELLAQQFISAARLDEAQRAVAVARSQRDTALAAARAQQPHGAETDQAQAQREAARAAVQAARARLEQAALRAPANGRVLARLVEPGQIVQPGRALLTLGVEGPMELLALVDERFLAQLQPGQRASVLADAYPRQAFAAQLVRLAPAVDAQRGAIEVRLRPVATPPGFLREDMSLSVEVVTGTRQAARVLPLAALREPSADGERASVLVAIDGRAQARALRLGLRTMDQVEVTEGLHDDAPVLLGAGVQAGDRVRPRSMAATPANPASTNAAGTSRDSAGTSPMAGFGR